MRTSFYEALGKKKERVLINISSRAKSVIRKKCCPIQVWMQVVRATYCHRAAYGSISNQGDFLSPRAFGLLYILIYICAPSCLCTTTVSYVWKFPGDEEARPKAAHRHRHRRLIFLMLIKNAITTLILLKRVGTHPLWHAWVLPFFSSPSIPQLFFVRYSHRRTHGEGHYHNWIEKTNFYFFFNK